MTDAIIDFWIVRKGEDAWKVAPSVGGAISKHSNNGRCLFCGDGHESGAVIAFCLPAPDSPLYTADICMNCAGHDDEKLAEMTQQEVFPDRVEHLLYIMELCDELEAEGLLETVGIDPVTGSKVCQMTAKGREHPELWDEKPKH